MKNTYYVTAAIPYVNAAPHIGHALEFVQADVIARYHRFKGDNTYFVSGGDENALKNVQAAEKANIPVQEFVDQNTKLFMDLSKALGISFDTFLQSSNRSIHYPASQKLWNLCRKDIYKKEYTGLYCVGCETFYERQELDENGECFEHPGKPLEEVSEKNYFFMLSKYQKQIVDLISSDTLTIYPQARKNEILSFLREPLHDISISRSNKRARDWGIPVPDDSSQRMYVWFDALNVYQSAIGFGTDEGMYHTYWPANVHVIGKGIIRFHAVYWIAFLLSAGLELPKELFVHGYITVEGKKMSKTIGNVIDPHELIEAYGIDPVRYYLLREIPSYGDGDFSISRFVQLYNSDLANGLGNLVSRVAKLSEKAGITIANTTKPKYVYSEEQRIAFQEYRFNELLQNIWVIDIAAVDQAINQDEPWAEEDANKRKHMLMGYIADIRSIAYKLLPFMPGTVEKILSQFSGNVSAREPLFPRISS